MKNNENKILIHSYDEFLKVYFTSEVKKNKLSENPYEYGIEMAYDSIRRLKESRKEQNQ